MVTTRTGKETAGEGEASMSPPVTSPQEEQSLPQPHSPSPVLESVGPSTSTGEVGTSEQSEGNRTSPSYPKGKQPKSPENRSRSGSPPLEGYPSQDLQMATMRKMLMMQQEQMG